MATITMHPEHLAGFRYLLQMEFSSACSSESIDQLRELIAFGDQLGWDEDDSATREISVSEAMLDKLVTSAREFGNSLMADVYTHRARGGLLSDPARDERHARSLLALAEFYEAPGAIA